MSPRLPLSQRSVGSLWRAVFVALFACTLTGPGAAQARGQWQQTYKLTAADADAGDIFGQSVSIDGNLIVIGAQLDEDAGTQSGSAYVYRFDGSNWIEEAKLTASDGAPGDRLGVAVSVSGNVIVVGAAGDDDGEPSSGSAYVFRFDGTQWIEEAKLTDPNGEELDLFGFSVSIQGNVALVGAGGNDDAGLGTGAAFVFRYDPLGAETWVFQQQLNAVDAEGPALFGWSVKLSGDVALITAPQDNSQTGAAYVFRDTGTQWVHEIKLTAADPVGPFPFFGWSSSISGDTILVGARSDYALGGESGAAHLFRKNRTGWEEVIKLTASDGEAGDFFGASLSISGDVAFISARPQNATGTVYIFDLDPTPGDLDCNGRVGVADLLALLSTWGPCDDCQACAADLDGNCIVGVSDLLILLMNWG
ncbi:MAG: FG-GAP repeat protein [Planctomycetes bacterium]|nr:FG-GAP repeat protein [Planctomycetota bacterium]